MKYFLSLISTIFILFSCTSQEPGTDLAQSEVHYNLGIELAQMALYQNSIKEFELAIKFNPKNVKAYRKKGLVYYGLKQYEEAEKLFEKAISLDPKNVQSYINLGMVKYSKGEKPEAKKLWKYSIDLNSDDNDAKAFNNIANLYKEEKLFEKAIEYYKLAAKDSPKNTMYISNLADTFRTKGEPERAIKVLKQSLKLHFPGMATHFNLGMAYKDLKKYKEALNSFNKSLEVSNLLTEAHYEIAEIQLFQKNRDLALDSIKLAIKSKPENVKYQNLKDKILDL